MNHYTYLLINIACLIVPFLASFYPKHPFFREWKYFIPANAIVAIAFLIWDYYFTKLGIWGFNNDYLTNIYFLNLPLEEILFFFAIPYACVFTWFALKYLLKGKILMSWNRSITLVFAVLLFLIAILNIERAYTFLTFLLTSIYLIISFFAKRDLSLFYLAYILIIPFFLLSNGVLTGTGLAEAIVWYNDSENLGIRILSIPIEDSVYGFLLIGLNIELFKWFKTKY